MKVGVTFVIDMYTYCIASSDAPKLVPHNLHWESSFSAQDRTEVEYLRVSHTPLFTEAGLSQIIVFFP